MKKTLVFMASALFVALMAVSCNETPAEATEEEKTEQTTQVDEPQVEEQDDATDNNNTTVATDEAPKTVNIDQELDAYEKFVVDYEGVVNEGSVEKAMALQKDAENAKAKLQNETLTDDQMKRFNDLNKRLAAATVKAGQKTAEGAQKAADALKGLKK